MRYCCNRADASGTRPHSTWLKLLTSPCCSLFTHESCNDTIELHDAIKRHASSGLNRSSPPVCCSDMAVASPDAGTCWTADNDSVRVNADHLTPFAYLWTSVCQARICTGPPEASDTHRLLNQLSGSVLMPIEARLLTLVSISVAVLRLVNPLTHLEWEQLQLCTGIERRQKKAENESMVTHGLGASKLDFRHQTSMDQAVVCQPPHLQSTHRAALMSHTTPGLLVPPALLACHTYTYEDTGQLASQPSWHTHRWLRWRAAANSSAP
jgi:hypothetical protein